MTIAHDATSNATPGTSTLSWTHTPVGTPRGVIVFVMQYNNGTDQVTGVTYGGTAMTEVTGSPLLKTSGEAMAVYAYFLGAAVPAGAQTVQVSVNATGSDKAAVCFTVTGADTIAVQEADATITSDSVENPSTALALGGREAFCAIGFCAGGVNVAAITPLTNWTSSYEYDAGAEQLAAYRYNIIGTTDVTAGWTQGADDALAIAIAIREATLLVTKSEGVTLGESGSTILADALAVSKSEGVTLGEARTVEIASDAQPDRDINVTDGVTLGEARSGSLDDLALSKSDGITLGEASQQAVGDITTSVTDGITIADLLPGRYIDSIRLGEVVTVSMEALADYEVTVSDGVTVGETSSAALDDLAVSKAEGVTVGEASSVTLPDDLAINQSDNITLGEASNVILEVEGEYYVSVSDGMTVGETSSAALDDLVVSRSEGVTVGEASTASLPDALAVSKADGVTIADAATVQLEAEGEYYVSVSDGVTLGETVAASLPDALAISRSEGVTLGEATTVTVSEAGAFDISVSDGVTMGESVAASLPDSLAISATDGVTLAESLFATVTWNDITSMFRVMPRRQPRKMIDQL